MISILPQWLEPSSGQREQGWPLSLQQGRCQDSVTQLRYFCSTQGKEEAAWRAELLMPTFLCLDLLLVKKVYVPAEICCFLGAFVTPLSPSELPDPARFGLMPEPVPRWSVSGLLVFSHEAHELDQPTPHLDEEG